MSSHTKHVKPIAQFPFLVAILIFFFSQNGGYLQFAEGGNRRIPITDDVVDQEKDDTRKEWGKKSTPSSNFNPPEIQVEMMKRHSGPAFGLRTRTPSSFSVVVFSYQKTVMHCVVDVMSFGTKLIQSNSHKLWRIISTHFFNLKTSVQKNRESEQRVRQGMGDMYALDFDGVICDSCGESSLSAVKAAKVRWPILFNGVDLTLENWVVDQMHVVRPVVETGYENLLLVRLLLEMRIPSIRKSSVPEGLTVEGILDKWSLLKPVIMEEWGEDKDALIHLFGKVRDEWMDQDLTTWIGANRLYPGVSDALKFASSTIYIVTTKQSRFADALLRELAGVTIPPERIFGLGSGPKVEVLKMLQKKPEHQGLKLHFVEDRLATLKNVIKEPELDGWSLYLGDWGYNTEKERDEAARIPRIQILQLSDFSMKLK